MRLLFWLWQAACPLDAATASEEDVSFSHLFGVFLFLGHLQLPCRKSSPISSVALGRFSFDFEPWNPFVTVETLVWGRGWMSSCGVVLYPEV
jgi:hypothetical protein